MIKFRSVNEISLGFGFDWKTTSSSEIEKKVKQECGKNGDRFSYYIRQEKSDSKVDSFIYTTTDEEDALDAFPAAHLIFDSLGQKEDLIFIYKISDETAWVCCIYKNEIVTGGDLIISVDNAEEEFAKLAEKLGSDDLSDITLYADKDAFDINTGREPDYELNLEDIVESSAALTKKGKFKKASSQKDLIIKAAAVAAMVLAGGYYFYGDELVTASNTNKVEEPTRVDTKKLLKQLPKMQSRNTDDFIDKSITKSDDVVIREARRQEIEWLNDDLNLISEPMFISYLHDTVFNSRSNLAGWKLTKVTFDFSNPKALELQYAKTSGGTALTLTKALSGKAIAFSPNGDIANTLIALPDLKGNNSIDFRHAINENHDVIQLMHDLDMSRIGWSMSRLNLTERQEPIKGLKDSSKENERQLKLDSREVIIKGNFLSQLQDIQPVFEKTNKFLLERVVININNKVSWSLYGVYHNNFAN